jgi:hypothetical protein
MSDLGERLRNIADAAHGIEWELPITTIGDLERAAAIVDMLDEPAILLAVPQPQRMSISGLLHSEARTKRKAK